MIELTLSTSVWLIGLMIISLYFRSCFISLLTGIFIIYEALLYTQIDKSFCLLLVGFGVVMIGYAMIFSDISLKRNEL